MIFHDWSLLPKKSKPLNDYTWDEISEISASGKAASMSERSYIMHNTTKFQRGGGRSDLLTVISPKGGVTG